MKSLPREKGAGKRRGNEPPPPARSRRETGPKPSARKSPLRPSLTGRRDGRETAAPERITERATDRATGHRTEHGPTPTAADEPAKGPNGLPILKVGTSGTFPPFEFHNSETGELVGFEIDLVRAIGQKMGRDVVISDFSFDAILPAITSGTIDMGAAGFAKTAERAKRIHFCDTFYYSGLTIIKRKGDTRINGIEDLAGKTISVQLGSISHERAKKIPGAKVVTFESGSEAMLNLITENCDAVINSRPSTDYMVLMRPSLAKKVERLEPIQKSEMGMVVRKGNEALAAEINKALAEIHADGTYDAIEKKWFGQTSWQIH